MPPFLIIIHDVSPCFEEEIEHILNRLSKVDQFTISGAIVPDWHRLEKAWSPEFIRQVNQGFDELLLHGMYHSNPRPLKNTFNEWEFLQLPAHVARQRLELGQRFFEQAFERKARGFVAPAWQSGPVSLAMLKEFDMEYMLGFQYFRSAEKRASLQTWSWDWGSSYLGHLAPLFAGFSPRNPSLVQVVIHPKDVRNGFLDAAIHRIQTMQDRGFVAALPKDLLR